MNRSTKGLVGALAAVGLFAGGAWAGPTIPLFADHDDIADAHRDSVEWAAQQGIVRGYADGSFRPTAEVSRQQLSSMLHRYHARSTMPLVGEPTRVPAGEIASALGRCPEVMAPLSGGFSIADEPAEAAQAAQISVLASHPAEVDFEEGWSSRGWEARVANGSDRDITVQVSGVCAPAR